MARRNLSVTGGAIPMEPGERTLRVLIQQRPTADAVDGSGAPTDGTWSTLQYAWMRRLDMTGQERFVAGQMSGPKVAQWEMGYVATMDPEQVDVPKLRRLVWQDRIYDITDASTIGQYEGIELMTLSANRGVTQ